MSAKRKKWWRKQAKRKDNTKINRWKKKQAAKRQRWIVFDAITSTHKHTHKSILPVQVCQMFTLSNALISEFTVHCSKLSKLNSRKAVNRFSGENNETFALILFVRCCAHIAKTRQRATERERENCVGTDFHHSFEFCRHIFEAHLSFLMLNEDCRQSDYLFPTENDIC